jgi:hypothetical protein
MWGSNRRGVLAGAVATAAIALGAAPAVALAAGPTPTSQQLKQDVLTNADMWAPEPQMLAAGLGFTNIIGVPGMRANDLQQSEQIVRDAGGTWMAGLDCENTPALGDYTSAVSPAGVAYSWGYPALFYDGLPVEFSWPARPSTVDPDNFLVTLNTGEEVVAPLAAVNPNNEYNERSTVVLFGDFGNRIPSDQPGSEYATKVEVVADDDGPFQLVGTNEDGETEIVDATGMSATKSTSPYDDFDAPAKQRTGPQLAAAKLSRLTARGESAPPAFQGVLPNDGKALYGDRAKFRLRMLTTGGFSPDGVSGVKPTEFERYFRFTVRDREGNRIVVKKEGKTYDVDGYDLKVIGLADLGPKQDSYDDCYGEDHDNQIDIVIDGDLKAVKRIRRLLIPSRGPYDPLYNPGGPGNDPTAGVPYSAGSPYIRQAVTIDTDNELSVYYNGTGSR